MDVEFLGLMLVEDQSDDDLCFFGDWWLFDL